MMKRTRQSRIPLYFALLFATNALFAQPTGDNPPSAYLDFGEFSSIAPADRLGFLDRLKWAGMIFVNAPAARRVVPLYDYTREGIGNADCSSDRIQDHRALFVTSLVPTDDVIAALQAIQANSGNEAGSHDDVLSGLEEGSWVEDSVLRNLLQPGGESSSPPLDVPEPELVWHEFSISNSCELQQSIADLDYGALTWHSVDDPKLRTIIQSGPSENNPRERIIMAEQLFPESALNGQYYAECKPSNELQLADDSLCDTVP